ncbi:MAG: hypothetical protein JXA37_12765, partial [Chloroflexia bacterium]|nr:hypothetical protein [Chloroflexia bacterium]
GQLAEWDGSAWVCAEDDVDDADADPANELNVSLVLSGTELLVTDAGGTIVADLGTLVDDADADPANELNVSLVLSGTELLVTDAGGTLTVELGHIDTLSGLACAGGEIAKWDGMAWVCAVDEDTTYKAGFGLGLAGTTFNVLTTTIQQRISGVCAPGSSIQQVHADGSVVCEPDDDTTYQAGFGLDLAGTTFNVLTSTVQQRISGVCAPGSSIQQVHADGSVVCEPDDDTTYQAGFGLTLTDTTFSVFTPTIQQRVTGTCPAGSFISVVHQDGSVTCEVATPPGAVMFFALSSCPAGWTELTQAQGRVIVGLVPAGTLSGTVGVPLTDLEDRTHTHDVDPPVISSGAAGAHNHGIDPPSTSTSSSGSHSHSMGNGSSSVVSVDSPDGGASTSASYPSHVHTVYSSGLHTHYVDIPTFGSYSVGDHTHIVDVPNKTSTSSSTSQVIPYMQLLVCVKD